MNDNELETADGSTIDLVTITGELHLEVAECEDHEVRGSNWGRDRPALRQELSEVVERELDEDPEQKARCIDILRSWIENNNEFYGRTDDSFILRYLRVCKFDLEKSKKKILRGYKIRHSNPDYFCRSQRNETMMEELISNGFMYSMDFAGNAKENVFIIRFSRFILKKYTVEESVTVSAAIITEVGFEDPRNQVFGIHFVFDFAGITLELLRHGTPSLLWRMYNMLSLSAPLRIRGLHMLNAPAIANKIFVIVKFILTKKLRQRLHVHKDMESFYEHISPKYLPNEYGGSAGPEKQICEGMIVQFRAGKEVTEENLRYGIGKHPNRDDTSDSDSDSD